MTKSGAFVVTGSGSGIGEAIARRLVAEGHHVFGVGRSVAKLEQLASELPQGRFAFAAADLAAPAPSLAATAKIKQWLRTEKLPLHGLVNNAGVYDYLAFHLSSDAIWERHFHNNLLSAVRLTRELYPELKSSVPSSVLNISSTLGTRPVAHMSAYSALKAAMVNLTQSLALEWAREGIRVNCICPGIVDTPIHEFNARQDSDPARVQAHAAQPMGRMGRASEIAAAAWFLLSEQSAWTTGSITHVDGGISL